MCSKTLEVGGSTVGASLEKAEEGNVSLILLNFTQKEQTCLQGFYLSYSRSNSHNCSAISFPRFPLLLEVIIICSNEIRIVTFLFNGHYFPEPGSICLWLVFSPIGSNCHLR